MYLYKVCKQRVCAHAQINLSSNNIDKGGGVVW